MNVELTVRGQDQDHLEFQMAALLRRCGWDVNKLGPWITCKEVQNRFNIINPGKLSMQLQRFGKEKFPHKDGPSGHRIVALKLTPELEAYLTLWNK